MNKKELQKIEDTVCPKCENRKPRSKNDCTIFHAILRGESDFKFDLDKVFPNKKCSSFKKKQK